jgi:hypothetical protein
VSEGLKYQIKRRNDQGSLTWEVWELTKPAGWFRRAQWSLLASKPTEKQAYEVIRKRSKVHYDKVDDYDENGSQIIYGW